MCPGAVVILLVRAQHMAQMPLAKYEHMIEALASDGADQSFSATVLPRRSRRCRYVANAHRANAPRKCLAVDTVAITNEVVRTPYLRQSGLEAVHLNSRPNRRLPASRAVPGMPFECFHERIPIGAHYPAIGGILRAQVVQCLGC